VTLIISLSYCEYFPSSAIANIPFFIGDYKLSRPPREIFGRNFFLGARGETFFGGPWLIIYFITRDVKGVKNNSFSLDQIQGVSLLAKP
jgi:hypothetical protein